MTSLERPSAARRTILARMISQYGDVYLRALDWSCSCSSLVSLIRNGLDLGKPVTSAETKSSPEPNVKARTIRHRIYETEYLGILSRAEMRRSTRIVRAVPMRVTGVDLLGQPFWERTATLDVNSHGPGAACVRVRSRAWGAFPLGDWCLTSAAEGLAGGRGTTAES